MASDNPARLLYQALDKARHTPEAKANKTCLEVWTATFGMEGADLARKLGLVQQLSDEVRRCVLTLPDVDREPSDEPMRLIELAWLRDLGSPWSQYWSAIDGDGTLRVLKLAAAFIDQAREQHDHFPIEDVERLRQHVRELLDEVVESEIQAPQKRIVIEHLREILDALDDDDLRTTKFFRRLVEAFAGRLGVDPDLLRVLRDSKSGDRVLRFVAAVVLVASATKAGVLPGSDHSALQLPKPDQTVVLCLNPALVPQLPAAASPRELNTGDSVEDPGTESAEEPGPGEDQH